MCGEETEVYDNGKDYTHEKTYFFLRSKLFKGGCGRVCISVNIQKFI